jgi:lysozyme
MLHQKSMITVIQAMDRPIAKTVFAISGAGLIVLASNESFAPMPYKDSGGVLTDGFGNTRNVVINRKVSVISGLTTLKQNVQHVENALNKCVTVPLYQYEFDAMIDLGFNIGAAGVCNSSVVRFANQKEYVKSCNAYLLFDKIRVNGQLVSCRDAKYNCRGIITRREKERAVCFGQY